MSSWRHYICYVVCPMTDPLSTYWSINQSASWGPLIKWPVNEIPDNKPLQKTTYNKVALMYLAE